MSKNKEALNAMTLKPTIGRIKPIKPKINVGGKLDHFNGNWYYDKYGGAVLNGGVSFFFAVAGEQNRYKTAIARAIGALAFSRVYWLSTVDEKYTSYYSAFDTETNTEDKRYITMFSKPWYKFAENPVDNERWILSDVGATTFDSWVTNWRNTCKTKRDTLGKQLTVPTPFLERDGSPLTMILPTFTDMDSISQARTEQQNDMHDEHEISSSKLGMYHARGGLGKSHAIDDIPPLAVSSSTYMLCSVQTKKATSYDNAPPKKTFQDMPQDIQLSGVPRNFLYLVHDCLLVLKSERLTPSDKSGPKWPRADELRDRDNPDLNIVTVVNQRGKSGLSGVPMKLVVSQTEGYLPRLTMFNDIWDEGMYGLVGTNSNYALTLMPDVKLTRTTVRNLIDTNEQLARALEITADLCYMDFVNSINGEHKDTICTPEELYNDIIKLGYSWDDIFNTRSWWTPFEDKHPMKRLTTKDLLNIRAGRYAPKWLSKK